MSPWAVTSQERVAFEPGQMEIGSARNVLMSVQPAAATQYINNAARHARCALKAQLSQPGLA